MRLASTFGGMIGGILRNATSENGENLSFFGYFAVPFTAPAAISHSAEWRFQKVAAAVTRDARAHFRKLGFMAILARPSIPRPDAFAWGIHGAEHAIVRGRAAEGRSPAVTPFPPRRRLPSLLLRPGKAVALP